MSTARIMAACPAGKKLTRKLSGRAGDGHRPGGGIAPLSDIAGPWTEFIYRRIAGRGSMPLCRWSVMRAARFFADLFTPVPPSLFPSAHRASLAGGGTPAPRTPLAVAHG